MTRISSGTMTVVVMAILVGLGGAFVVRQEMAKHKPPELPMPSTAPKSVIVPVAAMDLEPGQSLTINDIALMSFNQKEFAKTKYSSQAFMANAGQIQGRTLKMGLRKGEAFIPEYLYPEGLGPGISDRLQAGYRAVTVPIENIGAVQGFARPGTWVDVLFRSTPQPKVAEQTMTLLERIEVLAINESLIPNRQVDLKDQGTVTLAVTPHQAKILKVVEGRGELSLALRHPDDTLDMAPFTIGELDPHRGASSLFAEAFPVSHTGAVDRAVDRADRSVDRADRADRADRSDRSGANDHESLEGIVGHSNERITLDDLLGLNREPEKRQIEVFMGSTRSVVEFNIPNDEPAPAVIPTGGRIRTPIAHGPATLPSTKPVSRNKASPTVDNGVNSNDRS